MAIAETAITAAATLGAAGIGAASNAVRNKKQFKYWQKQMAESQQYQIDAEKRNMGYQKELFDMENKYNSPSSQMARYKMAGLNPQLMTGVQPVTADAGTASAAAPQASHMPVSGFMDNVDPFSAYQMYMNNEQLELQKKIAEADIRKTNADADATEIDNLVRDSANNLNLAISELQKQGIDLDNKAKELANDIASIQKEILSDTKEYEKKYKEYLSKDKENEYNFNVSERAFNISTQEDRLTQLKQKIIQDWLNIGLSRLEIDKQKIMKSLYSALAPLADKLIPSIASGLTDIADYFGSDSFTKDSTNFFEMLSELFKNGVDGLQDPEVFARYIKEAMGIDPKPREESGLGGSGF